MRRAPIRMLPLHRDDGAGGVLALALVGVTVLCALAVIGLGGALVTRQHLAAAADASALAAADVLLGVVPGDPCTLAGRVAAVHRVALVRCTVDGQEARVTVGTSIRGIPVELESHAGPPP